MTSKKKQELNRRVRVILVRQGSTDAAVRCTCVLIIRNGKKKEMKLEQMTIFDLLAEMKHDWKKIPDEASVRIWGEDVINVIDCGIKKEENIEFAARGFINDEEYWIGCVRGSNGEAIAIMYADDLNKDEIEDLMKKENDES